MCESTLSNDLRRQEFVSDQNLFLSLSYQSSQSSLEYNTSFMHLTFEKNFMSYNFFIYIRIQMARIVYFHHRNFPWKLKLCTNILFLLTAFFKYLHNCTINTLWKGRSWHGQILLYWHTELIAKSIYIWLPFENVELKSNL